MASAGGLTIPAQAAPLGLNTPPRPARLTPLKLTPVKRPPPSIRPSASPTASFSSLAHPPAPPSGRLLHLHTTAVHSRNGWANPMPLVPSNEVSQPHLQGGHELEGATRPWAPPMEVRSSLASPSAASDPAAYAAATTASGGYPDQDTNRRLLEDGQPSLPSVPHCTALQLHLESQQTEEAQQDGGGGDEGHVASIAQSDGSADCRQIACLVQSRKRCREDEAFARQSCMETASPAISHRALLIARRTGACSIRSKYVHV